MLAKKLQSTLAGQSFGSPTYVENVFSTYLYTGNGSSQNIRNDILLGDGPANGAVLQLTGDSIVDSSPVAKTLTNSNVSVSTGTKKYGTGSMYFDGSSGTRLSASSSAFDISGNTDFTMEFWGYFPSFSAFGGVVTQYQSGGGTNRTFALETNSSGGLYFYVYNDSTNITVFSNQALSTNTWTHIAVGRKNGVFYGYINGTRVGSAGDSSFSPNGPNVPLCIGNYGTDYDYPLNGYIDDFRFVTGQSIYDGSASITVPTAALDLDTLVDGEGGLVWIKNRASSFVDPQHTLTDTERGATKWLETNSTSAQATTANTLTAFNNNGFSIGSSDKVNENTLTYASWTFRKQPKFFDVVKYTGNATPGREIAHNLGSVPGCMIVKQTSASGEAWTVWHRSLAAIDPTYAILLNSTSAAADYSASFNSTSPTSTVFTVGDGNKTNASGYSYVAYLFAHNDGDGEFGEDADQDIIKCGSYTGNGSTDGPEIDLGWEPQWVLLKQSDGISQWYLIDNMRGWTDSGQNTLRAESSNAEGTSDFIKLTPTGFKLYATGFNGSGENYIYIAIRRGPMKTPETGTEVFGVNIGTNISSSGLIANAGFPVDSHFEAFKDTTGKFWFDRLRGDNPYLQTTSTSGEESGGGRLFANMSGVFYTSGFDFSNTAVYDFRRAPGFFDVVCYTGDGVAGRTVSHNLGVTPELMIVKRRNTSSGWVTYHSAIGNTGALYLDETSTPTTSNLFWNDTSPSSSAFTVGSYSKVNASGSTYVAYLFASVPGVSKVGSFTGNGSTQTIDCGFSNGARFVLIKRTDSTGDWHVFDAARGIVSGNDPYLELNTTNAEVTSEDAVDPVSSGFAVNEVSGSNINTSSATYIYLAIA